MSNVTSLITLAVQNPEGPDSVCVDLIVTEQGEMFLALSNPTDVFATEHKLVPFATFGPDVTIEAAIAALLVINGGDVVAADPAIDPELLMANMQAQIAAAEAAAE